MTFPRRTRAIASLVVVAVAHLAMSAAQGADAPADRARINALADRYVAGFKRNFPLSYATIGLPIDRHDQMDINSPVAIEKWRGFEKGLATELKAISPDGLAGEPEWVTWQFLNHTLRSDAATAICRNELWNVSAFGWQSTLTQIASIQPVGTAEARKQALARWRSLGPWIDQEIANLKAGQKAGYSATQQTVKGTIEQLNGYVDDTAEKSGYLEPAERDKDPAFAAEWKKAIDGTVLPALRRYRNYLRDEYLPHARASVSMLGQPNGRQCYRALVFSIVTADVDPDTLYDVAVKQVEKERALAVELGRKVFGDKATDWATLASLIRADPANRFKSREEVAEYTKRVYERAYASAGKVVLTPPTGQVKLEPFPDYQQATAPGGQYLPGADDGSRPATYYYRDVPDDLYRASLENVILHETIPGHHLQIAFLAEHGRKANHPIARMAFFSGPVEGWATYAEDFAREIGLYDSDVDYIGRLMGSVTPMMVADLGMQLKGWSFDQAVQYLQEAMPMRPPERAPQSIATISGLPGMVFAYPLGGMQWEEIRAQAEKALGKDFDVRAFHQLALEDGLLPFDALRAKVQRWVQQQQAARH